jgi:hypothetical protein
MIRLLLVLIALITPLAPRERICGGCGSYVPHGATCENQLCLDRNRVTTSLHAATKPLD